MKSILKTLLIWTSFTSVQAQMDYIPMSKDGNTWIYRAQWHGETPTYFGYRLEGDTIVDQKSYRILYNLDCSVNGDRTLDVQLNSPPIALMRDDTLGRMAYVRLFDPFEIISGDTSFNCISYETGNEDLVLFDFNVKVGDALATCEYLKIKEILPEIIHNTPTYRYIYDDIERMYMGIGHYNGLLFQVGWVFVADYWQGLSYFYNGPLEDFYHLIGGDNNLDYIPISKDHNLWIYKKPTEASGEYIYYGWYIDGDSTLNGNQYRKVFKVNAEVDSHSYNLVYDISSIPSALVRDDSLARESYAVFLENQQYLLSPDSTFNCIKYDSLNGEILLFDYSLTDGDTISACKDDWRHPVIVEKKEENYFNTQTYCFNPSYIGNCMGFGPSTDLFDQMFVFFIPECIPLLEYFCNGSLEDCIYNTKPNSIAEIKHSAITISPNPASDILRVSSNRCK